LRVHTLPAEPDRPPICIALLLLRVGAGGGWSLKQVATAARISPRRVSAYERGAEPLSRQMLDKLGAAMGYTQEQIDLAVVVGESLHRHGAGHQSGLRPKTI